MIKVSTLRKQLEKIQQDDPLFKSDVRKIENALLHLIDLKTRLKKVKKSLKKKHAKACAKEMAEVFVVINILKKVIHKLNREVVKKVKELSVRAEYVS